MLNSFRKCAAVTPDGTILCRLIPLLLFLLIVAFPSSAKAEPVSEAQVRLAAENWLAENSRPLDTKMGTVIREVVRYQGELAGDIGYYLVLFDPAGWLIVPGDDRIWPTMTFGPGKMDREAFEQSPWYDMTAFSSPQQDAQFRGASSPDAKQIGEAEARWGQLLQPAEKSGTRGAAEPPADVRVAPLLKTSWGQSPRSPYAHYGILKNMLSVEPKSGDLISEINKSHLGLEYPMGCNAVAIGQTMYYLMTERYAGGNNIDMNASSRRITLAKPGILRNYHPKLSAPLYEPNWGNMPLAMKDSARYDRDRSIIGGAYDPEITKNILLGYLPLNQREDEAVTALPWEAIRELLKAAASFDVSPLLRDIGVAINSKYGEEKTSAFLGTDGKAVFEKYGFHNVQSSYISPEYLEKTRWRNLPKTAIDLILRTNLDYRHPVVASTTVRWESLVSAILKDPYCHTFVVDGYGFEKGGTDAYYHINMGSVGDFDAWSKNLTENVFEVPNDMPQTSPSRPSALIYNIFADSGNAKGEIVSGRVAEDLDAYPAKPLSVTVRASWDGGDAAARTDENGIYALLVPSNTKVLFEVLKNNGADVDTAFEKLEATTGRSEYRGHNFIISNSTFDSTIMKHIGNVWGVDFEPKFKPVMVIAEREVLHEDISSILTDMGYPHNVVSIGYITRDMNWGGTRALFVEGNEYFNNYSFAGDNEYTAEQVSDAVIEIVRFARSGGHVFVTGNADNLIQLLGIQNNVTPFAPTRYGECVYGQTTINDAEIVGSAMRSALGRSSMTLKYTLPQSAHSMINVAGVTNSVPETLSPYLLRWVEVAGQADWKSEVKEFITSIHFQAKNGRVQYTNYPLAVNYTDNGAIGKALVEYQVNRMLADAGVTSDDASGASRGIARKISSKGCVAREAPGEYSYNLGYGNVVAGGSTLLGATLRMDNFAVPADLEVWRTDDDLILHVKGTAGQVKIAGWYDTGHTLSGVSFADGTILSADDLEAAAIDREPGVDVTPISYKHTVTAANGVAHGTKEDDIIFGSDGDDELRGGGGSNIFYYRRSEGHDTIVNDSAPGERNVLRFHTDITSADVAVYRRGGDLRFDIPDGSVTVSGWYSRDSAKLYRVETYDGAFWDTRDLERLAKGEPLPPRGITFNVEEIPVSEAAAAGGGESGEQDAAGSANGGCATGAAMLALALMPLIVFEKRNERA